jgi:hypothetical protein
MPYIPINGADNILANGSTTSRPLSAKVNDLARSVLDFGAIGNGIADDTAAIQATINQTALDGGGVIQLARRHKITATLNITTSNVVLLGYGKDESHAVGAQAAQASTTLIWAGAPGGTMVSFASPVGASNQKMSGGGLRKIYMNSSDIAAIGLNIASWNSAEFDDLFFLDFSNAAIMMDVVSPLGEAGDTQQCLFQRISARNYVNSGDIIKLQSTNPSNGNTSMNLFQDCDFSIYNGNGWNFLNSDNNVAMRCRVFRAGGGTGNAVVFNGANDALVNVARSNQFIHFSVGGAAPIIMRGTETYTYGSYDNCMWLLDRDNATPAPAFGTGVISSYSFSDGIKYFPVSGTAAFGHSGTEITNAKAAAATLTSSVIIYHDGAGHMMLARSDGTRWAFRINNGSVDFTLVAGGASAGLNLVPAPGGGYMISATKVVGPRDTGWTAMTGATDKVTAFDPSTITLPQLGQRVSALQAALTTHGLVGA